MAHKEDRKLKKIDKLIKIAKKSKKKRRSDAIYELILLSEDKKIKIAKAAILALGEIKAESACEHLIYLIKNRNNTFYISIVAQSLQQMENRAVTALSEKLKDARYDKTKRDYVSNIIYVIETMKSPDHIDLLCECANDKFFVARSEAVHALGIFNDKIIMNDIIRLLDDREYRVRSQAVWALGNMECSEAEDKIIKMLEDDNFEVQRSAVDTLAKIGSENSVQPLINMLGNESPSMRLTASKALEKIGETQWCTIITGNNEDFERLAEVDDPRIIYAMIIALKNDGSNYEMKKESEGLEWVLLPSFVRAAGANKYSSSIQLSAEEKEKKERERYAASVKKLAVRKIGKIGSEESIGSLIEMLDDKDQDVRREAIISLGNLKSTEAVNRICRFLDKSDEYTQYAAAKALNKIGDTQATDSLINALSSGDEKLRLLAIEALEDFGDTSAVEPLIKALSDNAWKISAAAASALGMIGDERAQEPLINLLGDKVKDVRKAAVDALDKLGNHQWKDVILGDYDDISRLIETKDTRFVVPIIDSLIQVGTIREYDMDTIISMGDAAYEILIKKVAVYKNDCNYSTVRNAIRILGRMGDSRAVAALRSKLDNMKSDARGEAAMALGQIGDVSAAKSLTNALKDANYSLRRAAGIALIEISKKNPETDILTPKIVATLKKPHTDFTGPHVDEKSCFDPHDDVTYHDDYGIGLDVDF